MQIIKTKDLTDAQLQQIDRLWDEEFPVKLNGRFKILLDGVENFQHYIIPDSEEKVLAWAVTFERDNETRFSIIVRKDQQGKKFGSKLLQQLKEDYQEFYGWVVDHENDQKADGENYHSPLAFYTKQGCEILHNQRIDIDILKAVKIKVSN